MTRNFTHTDERVARHAQTSQVECDGPMTEPIRLCAFPEPQEIIVKNDVVSEPAERGGLSVSTEPSTVAAPAYRTFLEGVLANMADEQ